MRSKQISKALTSDPRTPMTLLTSCKNWGSRPEKFWNWFLTKKNQIVDCPDAEAIAAFKNNIIDEWLARELGQDKPRTMATLTQLMT